MIFCFVIYSFLILFFKIGSSGYADGPLLSAKFIYPYGIALDDNDDIFVLDSGGFYSKANTIRGISQKSGGVYTVAGTNGNTNGYLDSTNGCEAKFGGTTTGYPRNIAIQPNRANIYISDFGSNAIRKLTIEQFPSFPTFYPTKNPRANPTEEPTKAPVNRPTHNPARHYSASPTKAPRTPPTVPPTRTPRFPPTHAPH